MRPLVTERSVETSVALLWMALGGVFLWFSQDIRLIGSTDPLGPRFIPQVLGSSLVILGGWLQLKLHVPALRRGEAAIQAVLDDELSSDDPMEAATPWRVPAVAMIVTAYLVFLPIISYIPATAIAGAAVLAVMKSRSLKLLIVYPIAASVALYLLFSQVLSVRLP